MSDTDRYEVIRVNPSGQVERITWPMSHSEATKYAADRQKYRMGDWVYAIREYDGH
jgi:hypothetical protein